MHKNIISLSCTPETNIILYVSCNSVKKKNLTIKEYVILLPLQNQNFWPSPLCLLPTEKIFEKEMKFYHLKIHLRTIHNLSNSSKGWGVCKGSKKKFRCFKKKKKSDWFQIQLLNHQCPSVSREARDICGFGKRIIYKHEKCISPLSHPCLQRGGK